MEELNQLFIELAQILFECSGITADDSDLEKLAETLKSEYEQAYERAGKPYGEGEEGLIQYVRKTKVTSAD